ncbi:MAG: beta-phosphoglucomutase family hydrolase [Tenuifilum sp.]|uniref:HAD family hydrolase n=1 Tax=Tenuifilum sp. TaxID=2760880 RepID=UPI003CA2A983
MGIDLKSFNGFIFDMDGVIVDNYLYHIDAWGEFCKRHGLNFEVEDFTRKYFGKNNNDILQALFGKSLSSTEIDMLGEEKEAIYRELYQPYIKPLDGLVDFMKELRIQGGKIAIASSAPQSNINFVVEKICINEYIDVSVNGNMVRLGKPNPDIFLKAAELLSIQPGKCLAFEDSFSGIQAAINAGMQVVALATTHKKEEHDPTITIISNFKELLQGY